MGYVSMRSSSQYRNFAGDIGVECTTHPKSFERSAPSNLHKCVALRLGLKTHGLKQTLMGKHRNQSCRPASIVNLSSHDFERQSNMSFGKGAHFFPYIYVFAFFPRTSGGGGGRGGYPSPTSHTPYKSLPKATSYYIHTKGEHRRGVPT